MSLPQPDSIVSTQYLQMKLPVDAQSSGDKSECVVDAGVGERQTFSNSSNDSSPRSKRNNGASPIPSCVSSTIINLTPSVNTAPVSSGSNCYFQERGHLSDEAKQATVKLRNTMAAIADKRSMFFSECPKSPKHTLDALMNQKTTDGACDTQPQVQRSSIILERNKDNHNFEVTSRDDERAGLSSIVREHPRLTPERTMSGFYFSRRPGESGRMSLKTFEMIKNCPSLELYTTAPITSMTCTPPVNLRPKISPPLQVSPPQSLTLMSGKPIALEIHDSTQSVTGRPTSSPDKYLRISISPCNAAKRRATENSREDVIARPKPVEQNGERSPLPSLDSTKLQKHSGVRQESASTVPDNKRFFSAPEAYPFQECEQDKRHPSGEESLPSTPNSGSLSSSMKSASINKLRSFFSDTTNISNNEGKLVESAADLSSDIPHQDKKPAEGSSRHEKGSFKTRKSNSKQLQTLPTTTSQGSPGSKHKKSPTEKDPQTQKESWKGRMARTIKRYGSGSILLSSDASSALHSEENKSPKIQGVFGVPLEVCEMSSNHEMVPLIVEVCIRVVEENGLDNQGIYRVPGNTGAIKELQDEINKDPKGLCLDSEKWQDVNLVTSLLKLFFRKLPDSLITDRLYEPVIATTRLQKSEKRMLKLKRILHDMPEKNFNTFALLAKHLNLVSTHEENNKMDAHNLAIMFGPTLIRPKDNNIAVMARNMADQCRVIETIILHCDWFFSSWDEDVNVPMDGESEESTPVIDENLVAKAQSLDNANQRSSSSSSLHQIPSATLVLSSSSSSIYSLPLTSPTGWSSVVKKFKVNHRDGLPPHDLRGRPCPLTSMECPEGYMLKSSSSEAQISGKNYYELFSPTSKKNFFSFIGKGRGKSSRRVEEELIEGCHSKSLPCSSVVGKELEIEVKVVRRDRYNLDVQSFGLADNRDPPKLPWNKKRGSNLEEVPLVFRSNY